MTSQALSAPAPFESDVIPAELRELLERTAPVSLSVERVLPVLGPLEELLPHRGIPRGSVVEVRGASGASSVMLALVAGASRSGSWVAFVGVPELGWQAAQEQGVELSRVLCVPHAAQHWPMVVGALLDGADVVVCGAGVVPTSAQMQNLRARARERGAVLLGLDRRTSGPHRTDARRARPGCWASADLTIEVRTMTWRGTDAGSGMLQSREIELVVGGRGGFSRPRSLRIAFDRSGALRTR
jgi:hypothetical protein